MTSMDPSNGNSDDEDTNNEEIELNIDVKKHFPNLAKEIRRKISKELSIDSIRFHDNEKIDSNNVELRDPDIISFLRRCETDEEGLEIINFMLRRKEISEDYAESLKIQLKTKGIRSFGTKKDIGYYEKTYGI